MNFSILPAAWSPMILSIFRIAVGLVLLEHGTGKLLGFPADLPGIDKLPFAMLLFTGLFELVGGVLITIGLFTRPVAFILSGFMAVAFFLVHFPMGFFPAKNYGEAAYLYCFAFLYLSAAGGAYGPSRGPITRRCPDQADRKPLRAVSGQPPVMR